MITKETNDFSGADFQTGEIILIDKPIGWTSFKVVHVIRKITGAKKVGHAGTLDPLATGLLILCTGKKTKEITNFQDGEKTYTGTITLGKKTPSMDLETDVIEEKPFEGIKKADIEEVRNSFLGEILQIPPMYSALKVGGKTLYNLARKGKTVKRESRKVNISKFLINKIDLPDIHFEIRCSKGTYIRVIANDLGENLGTGGVLSSLRRTKIGEYEVNNALSVESFELKWKKTSENRAI
ncbi:MAG: tRNA pseudouridine(55) synthase TruB [Ignavibacteriaceae bacterium]